MRIAIGSDHAGFELKQAVKELLSELGHSFEDFGCYNTHSVDYPDIGRQVAEAVARGEFERGILVCGSGIGMSVVANKVPGIRAALCCDPFIARKAREHVNANILCLSEWRLGKTLAREVVQNYLEAEFEGERHARRLKKIEEIEKFWAGKQKN